jgi:hypothetical protein
MDMLLRLLLRFILVPLGYLAAVLAGALVIVFGAWRLGEVMQSADPDTSGFVIFGLVLAGPFVLAMLAVVMWLPASVGILLAEAFAIRSWIYHAGNGAISAWLGWNLFDTIDDSPVPLHQPLQVVAAGLAGGFAYWAVAGWSAGFWKPVFRHAATGAAVTPTPGATDAAIPR